MTSGICGHSGEVLPQEYADHVCVVATAIRFCRKVVLENLYDAAAFMLASKSDAATGRYTEPAEDVCFNRLVAGVIGKAHEYLATKRRLTFWAMSFNLPESSGKPGCLFTWHPGYRYAGKLFRKAATTYIQRLQAAIVERPITT